MASQCKDCGADMKWPRCHRCERCQYSHLMANRGRDSTTSYPQLAHRYVARAIALGDIPALDGSVLCVDCEQPAAHYDPDTSLDASTKDKGGELGSVSRAQLDPTFGGAAFEAAEGATFGPLRSTTGCVGAGSRSNRTRRAGSPGVVRASGRARRDE